MRACIQAMVGTGIAATVVVAGLAPAASAHDRASAPANKLCFSNMNLKHASGADIPSNVYDDGSNTFDSAAADDFTLTTACTITEVDVAGTFDQTSGLDWEDVYVFPDASGVPSSSPIWVQTALHGKQGKQEGDFNIKFGPLTLQPGTYWISVRAQLRSGQWGWDSTTKQVGNPAVFEDPNGGFPGCPTWTPLQTCFPGTPGTDLLFALKGTAS